MARPKKRKMHKHIEPTTEGKCPFCKKNVKSLEHHLTTNTTRRRTNGLYYDLQKRRKKGPVKA